MATQLVTPSRPAAPRRGLSTASYSKLPKRPSRTARNRLSPHQPYVSPRSDNIAGQAVAISSDIPAVFDTTLADHHKIVGRWVAAQGDTDHYTRREARTRIEQVFGSAVQEILRPVTIVDMRAVVTAGTDDAGPALALICDTMGQLDLGWIENSDTDTAWRATAYQLIAQTVGYLLPISGYDDLINEYAACYWEGSSTDEEALSALMECHGVGVEEIDPDQLPSAIGAKRPAWMLRENAVPVRELPAKLRKGLSALRRAHHDLKRHGETGNAWRFEFDTIYETLPHLEEASWFPPLTIVPFEHFACQLDDVARQGMECGFMDVSGLCPLTDHRQIDPWLASLRAGVRFLTTLQDLVTLFPTTS